MLLTPEQVKNRLLFTDRILDMQGQIKFYFGNIDIVVKQKDVVGNIIQEWLQGWFNINGVDYALSDNTQMPPDFYLSPNNKTINLLEVKAFNRASSPGFDIADFRMYEEEIVEKPYMLYADYLIFGYDMDASGVVTIKDLWLKKVWEITRRMDNWPLNLQIKQGTVHKIRPGVWYSNNNSIPMFQSVEHFLSAIEETVYQNPKTHEDAASWKSNFLANYKQFYGKELVIPRWNDIKGLYEKT